MPNSPSAAASGLPPGSFITCSSDGSVRLWGLGSTPVEEECTGAADPASVALSSPTNMLPSARVIPVGRELQAALRLDHSIAPLEEDKEKADASSSGLVEGRCVRISPDAKWFAVGDRTGNLRLHALAPGLELKVIYVLFKSSTSYFTLQLNLYLVCRHFWLLTILKFLVWIGLRSSARQTRAVNAQFLFWHRRGETVLCMFLRNAAVWSPVAGFWHH